MQISKAALFGGALMSAGIAHASASTFQFAYSPDESDAYVSYAGVQAYGPSGAGAYSAISSDNLASPEVGIAYGVEGWNASANVTFSEISAVAYAGSADGNFANASATTWAYLSFSEDTEVLIEWDFADAPQSIQIAEIDTMNFNPIYDWEFIGDPLAGSRTIVLEGGLIYWFFGVAEVNGAGQTSTLRATVIPAPGAAALVGLAGIAGVRRRR